MYYIVKFYTRLKKKKRTRGWRMIGWRRKNIERENIKEFSIWKEKTREILKREWKKVDKERNKEERIEKEIERSDDFEDKINGRDFFVNRKAHGYMQIYLYAYSSINIFYIN